MRVGEPELDANGRESDWLEDIVVAVRWAWAVLFGVAALGALWLIPIGVSYGISWLAIALCLLVSAGCMRVCAKLIGQRPDRARARTGRSDRVALVGFAVALSLAVGYVAYLAAND